MTTELTGAPALSLILCSRNDSYMGNSRWRLETTLNYAAEQIEALGRAEHVEILITDWGSEIPLRDVLRLSPAAARIASFILVPPAIALPLQGESPFPEVLALNAAARRAKGTYIGRIDQDTLVGRKFLETFFELYEGRRTLEVPFERTLLFSNVRMIPYRFAVRCPPIWAVTQFIGQFGEKLKVEIGLHAPFYRHSVGIWLTSAALWQECGGYDEDMVFMNSMEIDMIDRLLEKHPMTNLGKIIGYDFYHLEHYHPWVPRKSSVYRKTNYGWVSKGEMNPNGATWGLADYALAQDHACPTYDIASTQRGAWNPRDQMRYSWLLALTGTQAVGDLLLGWWSRHFRLWIWRRRIYIVQETIRGEPVTSWYRLLRNRWMAKRGPTQGTAHRE